MECAVLGIPCFATDCLPYSRVMPKDQLFSDSGQLKQMLQKLKFASAGAYRSMVDRQWKWFHTPCREGDFQIKNFWLEDNLGIWIDLCRIRPKTAVFSITNAMKQYADRKKADAEKTIFKNENIAITK